VIEIDGRLAIPESELRFTASRASGPGGQHVNKVNSRVTLQFDLAGSPSLDPAQRERIARKLGGRVTAAGLLKLHSQRHRSQAANRAELIRRFSTLLQEALRRRPRRRKTVPSQAVHQRRLAHKQRRAAVKRARGKPDDPDEL
jgi:ribosome-associated protein